MKAKLTKTLPFEESHTTNAAGLPAGWIIAATISGFSFVLGLLLLTHLIEVAPNNGNYVDQLTKEHIQMTGQPPAELELIPSRPEQGR